jgi:hypothetical protein
MKQVSTRYSSGFLGPVVLFAMFLGLLASRRWEQLASPQVWDEDGGVIGGFIGAGWHEFLRPVNGYLILVPKVITGAALAVSIYYFPVVSTVLAWLFTALVALAVARAPTRLRGRALCAAAVFLVPSDPEVLGIPLYTFWWASILLLLVALWDETRPALWLRLGFVAAGGLSSPMILVVLPLLYFRAVRHRTRRSETAVALAATLVAGVQVHYLRAGAAMARPSGASIAQYVVPKFCGWFLAGNFFQSGLILWPAGLVVLASAAALCAVGRRNPSAWALVLLYLGAVAASIARVDPSVLHPSLAGPRYFFTPFLLTFWILIQLLLTAETAWLRRAAGFLAALGALNAIPVWTRHHDDLHWAEHVRSGRLFQQYDVPIEYDGSRFSAWSLGEPGATWDRLLRRDWLASPARVEGLATFAYRVVRAGGAGAPRPRGPGALGGRPSISFARSRSGRDEVVIGLRAGDRVRYRSGPVKGFQSMRVVGRENAFIAMLPMTRDWVTLEFSNSGLPDEFNVEVEDLGQGVGEWSAAGAPE